MIKFGTVLEVDSTKGRVRVRIFAEEIQTDFIPVIQVSVERFRWYAMPAVGETVVLLLDEKYEGVVLGSIYDDENVPTTDPTSIAMNGDGFGGLLKATAFLNELKKAIELLDAIKSGFENWTPVAMDGGAALKAIMTGVLSGKSTGNYENLVNDKIKHG